MKSPWQGVSRRLVQWIYRPDFACHSAAYMLADYLRRSVAAWCVIRQ
jgi:hypothetical protein